MTVTCTKKFPYNVGGRVRVYRPGNVIEDATAAQWAIDNEFGRKGKAKKAAPIAPENKAAPDSSENKAQ